MVNTEYIIGLNSDAFRTVRIVLGLSSSELSNICCISRQTLSALENGSHVSDSTKLLVGLVLADISRTAQDRHVKAYCESLLFGNEERA